MNWRTIKKLSKTNVKSTPKTTVRYAGFWSRVLAAIVDIFMLGLPVALITTMFLGYDAAKDASFMTILEGTQLETPPDPTPAIVNMVLYLVIYVFMWNKMGGQTPGKKFAKIAVVDRKSLQPASIFQLTVRFLGYALSFISIIGLLLPIFLPKKQALHDLLSSTVVIYK